MAEPAVPVYLKLRVTEYKAPSGAFFTPIEIDMTLPEYITANLQKPFAWGSHDCVLFAVGWLNVSTGRDHLAEFGSWGNAREAMRIVKRLGGLERAVDARLTRINPHLAKDGDLALYKRCLCLFSGAYIVGPSHDGLAYINRLEAECAWSY